MEMQIHTVPLHVIFLFSFTHNYPLTNGESRKKLVGGVSIWVWVQPFNRWIVHGETHRAKTICPCLFCPIQIGGWPVNISP
jgi:hypothetical protein